MERAWSTKCELRPVVYSRDDMLDIPREGIEKKSPFNIDGAGDRIPAPAI